MKKIKSLILSFMFALVGIAVALPMAFCSLASADETPVELEKVYISNATSFVSTLSDSTNYSKHLILTQNIDFSKVSVDLAPIWSTQTNTVFTGIFDGNGWALNDLTISSKTSNFGLFGRASSGAVIKNLNITGTTTFDFGGVSEPNLYLGILVGSGNNITIQNCQIGVTTKDVRVDEEIQTVEVIPTVTGVRGNAVSPSAKFAYGNFAGILSSGSSLTNCVAYTKGDFVSNLSDSNPIKIGGIVGVLDSSQITFAADFSAFNVNANYDKVTYYYGGAAGEVQGSLVLITNTASEMNITKANSSVNLKAGGVVGIVSSNILESGRISFNYWKEVESVEAFGENSTYKILDEKDVCAVPAINSLLFREDKNWHIFERGAWDFGETWNYVGLRLNLQVFQSFRYFFSYEFDNFSALDVENSKFLSPDSTENNVFIYKYGKPVEIKIMLKNKYKGYYSLNSVLLGLDRINDLVTISPSKVVKDGMGEVEEGYTISFNASDATDGQFFFNLEAVKFTCEVTVADVGDEDQGGVRHPDASGTNATVKLLPLGDLTIVPDGNAEDSRYSQSVEAVGKGKYNFDHWELYYGDEKCEAFDNSTYASLEQITFWFGQTEFFDKAFKLVAYFSDKKAISVDFVYNSDIIQEVRFYNQTYSRDEKIKVPPTARSVELVVVVKEGYEFDVQAFINFLTARYDGNEIGSLAGHAPITNNGQTSYRVTGINMNSIQSYLGENNKDFTMELRTSVQKTENNDSLTWLWITLGIAGALGIAGGVIAFFVIRRRNVARRLGGDSTNNTTKNKVKKTKAKQVDYKDYYN